jgi:hypothetical protein
MGRLDPANGWRSPEERDKLELHGSGDFDCNRRTLGDRYVGTGRPRVKLHAGGGERERRACSPQSRSSRAGWIPSTRRAGR